MNLWPAGVRDSETVAVAVESLLIENLNQLKRSIGARALFYGWTPHDASATSLNHFELIAVKGSALNISALV